MPNPPERTACFSLTKASLTPLSNQAIGKKYNASAEVFLDNTRTPAGPSPQDYWDIRFIS
jgi:uncharacterized membrane protein YccF (DUF307 family)